MLSSFFMRSRSSRKRSDTAAGVRHLDVESRQWILTGVWIFTGLPVMVVPPLKSWRRLPIDIG
jgi:hypothetical protein